MLCLPGMAQALCDVTYRAQPGDTLFSIAAAHYEDQGQWTLIYHANPANLGSTQQEVAAGLEIYIPCPTRNAAPDATPLLQSGAEMTLLTASHNPPFSDQDWPGNGLVTELINAALELSPSPVPYEVIWVDDWSRHLFPLLDEQSYDMGFPWAKPDCALPSSSRVCEGFHFSDPVMDLPVMLFKRADSPLGYESDADVMGARLCRPAGEGTDDLDRADRRWLSEGKITLLRPPSPEACFEALMAGEVDAVTLNVFLGASKVVAMGLRGRVVPLETALSSETLHLVISKKHWRGTTHLYRVNAGLMALRESGRYADIMQRHLGVFWQQLH
ncbi:MAG: transporter substrate-binding domain-containing protein [Roseovarius sp.]|nr:transporter substrate-binding domain-containing protein [Roseovarius sp.]